MRKLSCVSILLSAAAAMAIPAHAQDPYEQPDHSWISMSGVISSTTDDAFTLDYGEGAIIVEMDDWDWYDESKGLIEGDDVTVYGRVDNDLYEIATIEASSVYVSDLNAYFYASDADEEGLDYTFIAPTGTWGDLTYTGTITDTDDREFTLDTGIRTVRVDTIAMPYNPMDDKGYQKLKVGDLVQVSGRIDVDLFERRELMADTVVTLIKDKTKKEG